MGHRVRRGFRRIGAVLAVPLLAVSLYALVFASVAAIKAPVPVEYVDHPKECRPSNGSVTLDDLRCKLREVEQLQRHQNYEGSIRAVQQSQEAFAGAMGVALLAAIVAVFWFTFWWAVGFVPVGFARDDQVQGS